MATKPKKSAPVKVSWIDTAEYKKLQQRIVELEEKLQESHVGGPFYTLEDSEKVSPLAVAEQWGLSYKLGHVVGLIALHANSKADQETRNEHLHNAKFYLDREIEKF